MQSGINWLKSEGGEGESFGGNLNKLAFFWLLFGDKDDTLNHVLKRH